MVKQRGADRRQASTTLHTLGRHAGALPALNAVNAHPGRYRATGVIAVA